MVASLPLRIAVNLTPPTNVGGVPHNRTLVASIRHQLSCMHMFLEPGMASPPQRGHQPGGAALSVAAVAPRAARPPSPPVHLHWLLSGAMDAMQARTPQQQRAEAIVEALSATDAVDEAQEDQELESLAQRLEATKARTP